MRLDFESLGRDEYELFLPSPAFSSEKVALAMAPGEIYSDVIHIINRGEGLFHADVETVGLGLTVESKQLLGNDVTILYHIDSNDYQPGDVLSAFLLVTFLGGEKEIEFSIHIEEATEPRVIEVEEAIVKAEVKARPKQSNYRIQMNKRAYDLDEVARVLFTNHDLIPMTAKVINADKELIIDHHYITVNDIGSIEVSLRKSPFDFLWSKRKTMTSPVIHKKIEVLVTDEAGKHIHELLIAFTNHSAPMVEGKINNDKAFRKVGVQIQKLYVRYLIMGQKPLIKEALSLCEEAMAYHPTDVSLRLFYMMVLLELNMRTQLGEQVSSLIKYTDFYEEQGREEFVDIVNVTYQYLQDDDVTHIVNQWPMTTYRQLFRHHIFGKGETRFRAYEQLYDAGIRSVYIYALTVKHLNAHPEIPINKSKYYGFILNWAITKNWISNQWMKRLEMSYFQLITNGLVSIPVSYKLYAMSPTEGFLKLLGTILAENAVYTSDAYAIYYEVIRQKVYLKDGIQHYVKAAYANRLRIDIDHSQLSLLHTKLSHEELVYLYLQFRENGIKNSAAAHLIKRYFDPVVEACVCKNPSSDERALIAGELEDMVETHQWEGIKGLLSSPILQKLMSEYEVLVVSLVEKATNHKAFDWLEKQLPRTVIADLMDETALIAYFNYLEKLNKRSRFTYKVGLDLYNRGYRNDNLLMYISVDYRAGLDQLLELSETMKANELISKELMEKILYKGVLVRRRQDEVFEVYKSYRNFEPNQVIVQAMNRFFAAQILIEDMFGTKGILAVLEEDLTSSDDSTPIGLAVLKLYQQLGVNNEVISANLIKKSVKNGIIFPWFSELAVPYIQASQFRKAVFFSYHSHSYVDVTLHYICDDQTTYNQLKMKHVAFGMYIGYFVAFYQDHISYYYEEEGLDGRKDITESGIYIHDRFVEPEDDYNSYDMINTIIMSQLMEDDEGLVSTINHYVDMRKQIKEEMTLL